VRVVLTYFRFITTILISIIIGAWCGIIFSVTQTRPSELVKTLIPKIVKIDSDNWSGSGVFIADDTVLTVKHVVEGATNLRIVEPNGTEYIATFVIMCEDGNDLGIIKIKTAQVEPTISFDDAIICETVIHGGNPLNMQTTITVGVVSRINVNANNLGAGLLQIDAIAAPGSSGGPVFNLRGNLLGVVVGGPGPGFTFCIPSKTIVKFIKDS
jgi:S1-C subfamily serine protease